MRRERRRLRRRRSRPWRNRRRARDRDWRNRARPCPRRAARSPAPATARRRRGPNRRRPRRSAPPPRRARRRVRPRLGNERPKDSGWRVANRIRWPAFAQSTPTVPPILPAPMTPMSMMILSGLQRVDRPLHRERPPGSQPTIFTHLQNQALSFPSLLGKVARSAGWGMARCLNPSRIARPLPRTCVEISLLSTPHPALRATFPASRRRRSATEPGSIDLKRAAAARRSDVCRRQRRRARQAPRRADDSRIRDEFARRVELLARFARRRAASAASGRAGGGGLARRGRSAARRLRAAPARAARAQARNRRDRAASAPARRSPAPRRDRAPRRPICRRRGGKRRGRAGRGDKVTCASAAQAFDRLVKRAAAARASSRAVSAESRARQALQRKGEMGAAERQIVERDVENPACVRRPLRVCVARSRASAARPRQQQVAVAIPRHRISNGYSGCRFRCRRSASANRPSAFSHSPAAWSASAWLGGSLAYLKMRLRAVRKPYGFLRCRNSGGDCANQQFGFAQI